MDCSTGVGPFAKIELRQRIGLWVSRHCSRGFVPALDTFVRDRVSHSYWQNVAFLVMRSHLSLLRRPCTRGIPRPL